MGLPGRVSACPDLSRHTRAAPFLMGTYLIQRKLRMKKQSANDLDIIIWSDIIGIQINLRKEAKHKFCGIHLIQNDINADSL